MMRILRWENIYKALWLGKQNQILKLLEGNPERKAGPKRASIHMHIRANSLKSLLSKNFFQQDLIYPSQNTKYRTSSASSILPFLNQPLQPSKTIKVLIFFFFKEKNKDSIVLLPSSKPQTLAHHNPKIKIIQNHPYSNSFASEIYILI